MKIYAASSWRNPHYAAGVAVLRAAGHEVYDFTQPTTWSGEPLDPGFGWSELESGKPWQDWTHAEYVAALQLPRARAAFENDAQACRTCDACVLFLPCGRSAHLELGYVAATRLTVVVGDRSVDPRWEPELMYAFCDGIFATVEEAAAALPQLRHERTVREMRSVLGGAR